MREVVRCRVLGVTLFLGLWTAGCGNSGSDNPCNDVNCSGRGACVVEARTPYCICLPGYHPEGLACVEDPGGDPCAAVDCSGHGTCRTDGTERWCECESGYRPFEGAICSEFECDITCMPWSSGDGGPQDGGPDDVGPGDGNDGETGDVAGDDGGADGDSSALPAWPVGPFDDPYRSAPPVEVSCTYHVALGGADDGDGSSGAPWRTIARASDAVQPGETVCLHAGTYHERLAPQRSGNETDGYITYTAFEDDVVVIDGVVSGDPHDLVVAEIWQDWIFLYRLRFGNQSYLLWPGQTEYWVALNGSHVWMRGCEVVAEGDVVDRHRDPAGPRSRAVVLAGHDSLVEHNYLRGLHMGIVIDGPAPRNHRVRRNRIVEMFANHIDVGASPNTEYHGTLIEENVLDTSYEEDNIQFEPYYPGDILSTEHNRGTLVRANVLANAAENAVDFKGVGHAVFERNLVYGALSDDDGPFVPDCGSGPAVARGNPPHANTRRVLVRHNLLFHNAGGVTLSPEDHVYHNTLINNVLDAHDLCEAPSAFEAWNEPGPRAILNNVVATLGDDGAVHSLRTGDDPALRLEGNLYWNGGEPARFLYFERDSGTRLLASGLDGWRAAVAADGWSMASFELDSRDDIDPCFTAAPLQPTATTLDPTWDFGPCAGAPTVDAARPLTVATNDAPAGSPSAVLEVEDALFFSDGFAIADGDVIRVGDGGPLRIESIDWDANTLFLETAANWSAGDPVHLDFAGDAPDIGACERDRDDCRLDPP